MKRKFTISIVLVAIAQAYNVTQASDIPNPFVDGILEFHNHQPEDPFYLISSLKAAGQNHTGTKTEYLAKNSAVFGQIEACYDRWQQPATRRQIYTTQLKNIVSTIHLVHTCKKVEQALKHTPTSALKEAEINAALNKAQTIFSTLLKEQKDIHPYTIDPHLYILDPKLANNEVCACMNTIGNKGFVCASIQLFNQNEETIECMLRHECAHFVLKALDDSTTSSDDQTSAEIHTLEANTNTIAVCSAPHFTNTARRYRAGDYHADHLRKLIHDIQQEQKQYKNN